MTAQGGPSFRDEIVFTAIHKHEEDVRNKSECMRHVIQQVMHGGKMLLTTRRAARVLAVVMAAMLARLAPANAGPASAPEFKVPVEYYKLPNGLRVVLSPDHTSPIICVGVYYHIGFRIEPRDRTGFAHLFEHMMFQGSQNLGEDGVHQAGAAKRRNPEWLDAF